MSSFELGSIWCGERVGKWREFIRLRHGICCDEIKGPTYSLAFIFT